ncbi:uncharacterized protein SPPG_05781 [Spizellomyces punctatus DAOM BR117]|uniref:Uncharacterized protein n=1 Tax=Spizellomyces punctatus (strain DAOM BR117) TaxID=645134 RepID=A0A0L0HDI6_SPIPD|nr:uncharacterized protein SPPG_05781 [Spizellomyces punctatus DAOM BR117]KNC98803.1 hypothetical protein SPPG_05781 [Spizellomyces punctatus DAOM BR117]|eukprot:XP_016606843.1 hypothetical protein SPPG_05781 [Spizellomyces punctatus DAOM BR117]
MSHHNVHSQLLTLSHSTLEAELPLLSDSPSSDSCSCGQVYHKITSLLRDKDEEIKVAAELGLTLLTKVRELEVDKEELELQLYEARKADTEKSRKLSETESALRILEEAVSRADCDNERKDKQIENLQKLLKREKDLNGKLEEKADLLSQELAKTKEGADIAIRERNKARSELKSIQAQREKVPRSKEVDMGKDQKINLNPKDEPPADTDVQMLLVLAKELQAANRNLRGDLKAAEERIYILENDISEANRLLHDSRLDQERLRTHVQDSASIVSTGSSPMTSVFGELENVIKRTRQHDDFALEDRATGTAVPAASDIQVPSTTESLQTSLHSQLQTLTRIGSQLRNRLNSTDPQCLNRKIRRSFDMRELSKLSNSVIENIKMDVKGLPLRFPVLKHSAGLPSLSELYIILLLPLVQLVQTLLDDICILRTTINDYALKMYDSIYQSSQLPPHAPVVPTPSERPPETLSKSRSLSNLTSYILPSATTVATWFSRKPPETISESTENEIPSPPPRRKAATFGATSGKRVFLQENS